MRASSYNIYADLPGTSQEVLLIHGYSGAYDSVTRSVADFVRSLETRKPPKPLYGAWTPDPWSAATVSPPPASTVTLLKRRGYLTDLSEDQEETFFTEIVAALHESEVRGSPAYILMTTYDCNLRCSYCFQDHMRTDATYRHLLRSMSRDVVDRIVAAMPRIEQRHGVDSDKITRNITFFGGEPLLQTNRSLVEYIMNRVADIGSAEYSAVTNATELDAYADLLGPGGISALQITLDGPPERHDQRRIYPDGSGSFAAIADNIDLALAHGVNVEVRTNVDKTNLSDLPLLADEIIRHGWAAHRNFLAYTAPIAASNDKTDRRSTLSSWQLDEELTAMRASNPALFAVSRPDEGLLHRIRRIISGKSDVFETFRASYCGAHGRMYVIDAFADIYACWEKTGDRKIRIGYIAPNGDVVLNQLTEVWRSRTVASNDVCRKCRFAIYCGGGCAVRALHQSGTMFRNYCDGFGSRFRATAVEAYLHAGEETAESDNIDQLARAWLSERTLRA